MDIAILSVKDAQYHPNQRLMEAGRAMGHRVLLIHTRHCLCTVSGTRLGLAHPLGTHGPEVLLPRIGATINDYALAVVRHFQQLGVRVVNRWEAIALARNKFLTMQTLAARGFPVPRSYLAVNEEGFEAAARHLGGPPFVIKLLSSRQGSGVLLADRWDTARFFLGHASDQARGVLLQEFLPPSSRRDFRALVVGQRLVGAMELRPRPGDFRCNVHLGGAGHPVALEAPLRDLALGATRALVEGWRPHAGWMWPQRFLTMLAN